MESLSQRAIRAVSLDRILRDYGVPPILIEDILKRYRSEVIRVERDMIMEEAGNWEYRGNLEDIGEEGIYMVISFTRTYGYGNIELTINGENVENLRERLRDILATLRDMNPSGIEVGTIDDPETLSLEFPIDDEKIVVLSTDILGVELPIQIVEYALNDGLNKLE